MAVLNFLSGHRFSWPASHTAKGSVLSWAWAQAEGRAREGPLPFRQGGGAWSFPTLAGTGCWAVCPTLVGKP